MQEKVKEFNEQISHREAMPPEARLLDINSELGELAKEYLKATNYGTKDFEKTDDFELEFADCLYSLLSLACELNIDADKALEKVILKYAKRIKDKKNMGSGR